MPENRYGNELLVKGNQEILKLIPANIVLREELARYLVRFIEILNAFQAVGWPLILEVGIGEGDLMWHILKHRTRIMEGIDAIDISSQMLKVAEKKLRRARPSVKFICADVLAYLEDSRNIYAAVVSCFVFHNFTKNDRRKVFDEIYKVLADGGELIFIDKLYPDQIGEAMSLFDLQMKRYRDYLEPALAETIIKHELEDAGPGFIMKEGEVIDMLKQVGFREVSIRDRVEYTSFVTARK